MAFAERRGRDRLYIIAEILEIAKDGTLKTQIMYRANLSFTQLTDYLRLMLRLRLLKIVKVNYKEVYKATKKGLDLLQRYHEINELLNLSSMGVQVREENRPKEREMV
jgi:predicted transcriptional regulator